MTAVTKLSRSASGQVRARISTLAGSLPHEDEAWTWGDAQDIGMEWSDFLWMSNRNNNLIRPVDDGTYRTPRALADAVRHYADVYEVDFSGEDPLVRFSD